MLGRFRSNSTARLVTRGRDSEVAFAYQVGGDCSLGGHCSLGGYPASSLQTGALLGRPGRAAPETGVASIKVVYESDLISGTGVS